MLQNMKCYQFDKKRHLSRNCFDRSKKKKEDSNFTTENSEACSNQNSKWNSNSSNSNHNSNQNRRSNLSFMFVEYVKDSLELTHNQFSTRIFDTTWIVNLDADDHCSENVFLFMNESTSFNKTLIIVGEKRIAVINRSDI